MDIEFNGHFERPMYFKAISLVYRPSRRSLITRIAIFILFAILYAVLFAGILQKESQSALDVSHLLRHLITLLVLGYVVFQPYLSAYLTAARLWQDPVVRRQLTGRVSSLGIQYDPSKEWTDWGDFVKIQRTSGLVVLLTAARHFVALPQSFFKSDQEWKMLNQLIDSKVQEAI